MYKITFSKIADKTLRRMPGNLATTIVQKIKRLAVNPSKMHDVKKLTDHPGYRLRVGDWRILYSVNENEMIIHIVAIKTRGKVYK